MEKIETWECAGCLHQLPRNAYHEFKSPDRSRPVTSRCRECRREDYFRTRYPETVCGSCKKHRPLNLNKVCARCNDEMGLRECLEPDHVGARLLPLYLSFYNRERTCKVCKKSKPKKASEP